VQRLSSIFSQLLQQFPRLEFEQAVKKHRACSSLICCCSPMFGPISTSINIIFFLLFTRPLSTAAPEDRYLNGPQHGEQGQLRSFRPASTAVGGRFLKLPERACRCGLKDRSRDAPWEKTAAAFLPPSRDSGCRRPHSNRMGESIRRTSLLLFRRAI